jgi:hypothetical protein
MQDRCNTLFFALAIVVLMNALFVLQPGGPVEVRTLRNEIIAQTVTSFRQTIGDGPWFSEVADVYNGVEKLLATSADIMITMIEPSSADDDIIMVAGQVYTIFTQSISATLPEPKILGANFMLSEPIYNILPPFDAALNETSRLEDFELSDLVFTYLLGTTAEPASNTGDVSGSVIDISADWQDTPINDF